MGQSIGGVLDLDQQGFTMYINKQATYCSPRLEIPHEKKYSTHSFP